MKGKDVISMEEGIAKIRAAVEARDDPDFLIIARTDADVISTKEVIRRGNAYADAGADLIKPQPHSREELQACVKKIKKPLHIGTGSLGRSRIHWSVKELEELGNVKIVTFPLPALFAATKAMMDMMDVIKRTGTIDEFTDRMVTFEEFIKFIGLPKIYSLEKKYTVTQ
jgi:2-methylisocitrate lyase-like PEP mutase family enzyme